MRAVSDAGRTPDFVGAGWAFPVAIDATAGIAVVTGDREIEEAIRIILATAPGERPMRPEFGCRIHDHVFAPNDAATAGAIARDVHAALAQWEPRIDVIDVRVSRGAPGGRPPEEGVLHIHLAYVVRGSNDPRNLVFPFYVIPSETPS